MAQQRVQSSETLVAQLLKIIQQKDSELKTLRSQVGSQCTKPLAAVLHVALLW